MSEVVVPLLLSGRTEGALRAQAANLQSHIDGDENLRLADVGYSLATRRTHFAHRAVVLAKDRFELRDGLNALRAGADAPGLVRGRAEDRKVALLFSGEGGQRPGMGRELYATFPVFAQTMDDVCAHLAEHSQWAVRELLLGEDDFAGIPPGDRELLTQDALFVLQMGLFRLLGSWGLRPDYVLGHSVGEMAAATAAGMFSYHDISVLMADRVRLVQEHMPLGGAMAALRISPGDAAESLSGYEGRVTLAAVNSPSSVVISGDRDAVEAVVAYWSQRGRKAKSLPVRRAFHSHHMDPLLPGFLRTVSGLTLNRPRIPVVSIRRGMPTDELLTPDYWPGQVRGTSQYMDCVRWLENAGVGAYLEVGANGVLAALARDCLADDEAVVLPALRGGDRSDVQSLLTAVAGLHVNGVPVDWEPVFDGHRPQRVDLPDEAALSVVSWQKLTAGTAVTRSRWSVLNSGTLADRLTAIGVRVEEPADLTLTEVSDAATALRVIREWDGGKLAVITADDMVKGLVRAAQLEFPGRFVLVEADDPANVAPLLPAALATDEPHVAIQSGEVRVPSLAPASREMDFPELDGTVLVTGGTDGPGRLIAHHLVAEHGVRDLLLTGPATDVEDLIELGATVRVVETAAQLPDRLAGIVHATPVSGAGLAGSMTPEQLESCTRDYIDTARTLAERTDAALFVLITPAEALGMAGNTVAASVAHELVTQRHRAGMPAAALTWDSEDLFDAAVKANQPVVPASENVAETRELATERPRQLLDDVLAETAAVLNRQDVQSSRSFTELGFDSLAAVDLVRRLRARTGLPLATTAVFDHPSPAALASALEAQIAPPAAAIEPEEAEHAEPAEPIAIVAMSCRLPGGVRSPEDLWELLVEGRDAIGAMPSDRGWDESIYHPEPGTPGKTYVKDGGFLYDAADFDPAFFGISPREALGMDPQQRLLLELSWEAVERAGIDPSSLRGSATGVFAGVMHGDYGSSDAPEGVADYLPIGNAVSVATGRVAYTLGFEGPTLTVDTSCSSSLVAMHLAAQALRRGECSLALAGGVMVMSTPIAFVEFSRQRALAADGRCKPFAEAADGTAWAEGAGMLVLEKLSDAQRLGHPIVGVIRGSALNQDGASNGLTAPNGLAQQRVIRQALADAGMSTQDIDVVEAHGTGTRLGDPIEATALLATYGVDRDQPLLLGSLKSNIGHTQVAAGVAGVIKVLMAMRHGVVPKMLHLNRPTPHVDWESGSIELVAEATPWPRTGRARRAGVSSFGISGTNAHLILEQAPEAEESPIGKPEVPAMLWTLSGHTEAALRAQAQQLLSTAGDQDPVDVGYSLATTRAALEHRASVVGTTKADMLAGLAALADGRAATSTTSEGGLAFLFTGQGSQRARMGAQLYHAYPVFTRAFDECCAVLDPLVGRSLHEVFGDQEALDRTEYTQPALFALEVALYRLLESWGIRPDFLLGHSIGELAAAHVAGLWSLEDAATLVVARGRLMQALPPGGAMLAVEASVDDVQPLLSSRVSLAAVNGPMSVVLAGDEDALRDLVVGGKSKRLAVSHAFHSARMDPMLADFAHVAAKIEYRTPELALVSAVTGRVADPEDLCTPAYWVRQARETVRFADGIESLRDLGVGTFLELGPAGVLSAMTEGAVALLRPDRPEPETLLAAVSVTKPDWQAFYAGTQARRVDLPTYPFQRERYWLGPPPAANDAWRYQIEWKPIPDAAAELSGTWLVVVPDGIDTDITLPGAETLRLSNEDRAGIAARLSGEYAGVLSLLALAEDGPVRTAALIQALGDAGVTAPLWCVTQGAVNGVLAPLQATIWGLGRVAALEHPERWGGLIDLPDEFTDEVASRLAGVLSGHEDQVAIRANGVFTRRLTRAARTQAKRQWRPSGTVLITGGTGELGRRTAQWLAENGAEHVVLTSRRGTADVDLDIPVTVAACDVTDEQAMSALVASLPNLTAVVHAAGVLDDGMLDTLGPERFDAVLKPKVDGAWLLHELTLDRDLDAFVLFSSAAGSVGNAGQANYAAANAFLDALAEHRRALGLPATSIAWGAWADGGMAEAVAERTRRHGMRPMSAGPALAALKATLDRDETCVTVVDVDWARFIPGFTGARPSRLLSDLPEARQAAKSDEESWSRRLAGRSAAEQARIALDFVCAQAAEVLGHSSPQAINTNRPFRELGFDSLTVVELRTRLNALTGLKLPATVLFDHPTPEALAKLLLGEVEETQPVVVTTDDDPIVIVAMSCRLPGGADSPEALWELVDEGRDAIGGLPADRGWDLANLFDPDPDAVGKSYARAGGFLPDVADFDAEFFGISPREAVAMDPQQRLLLETVWEVFERAGIDPASVRGERIGVFAGTNGQDYQSILMHHGETTEGYIGTGSTASVVSGRISYTFALEGPAITVDTACSSSLVALHLAAQAIRAGECSMAVAGGVTVMTTPWWLAEFSRQRALSPDGRCKAFAAAADGTGWSEGVGVLLLERLSDARRNGHRVLAVVRGSAVNQDGASNGLTAPSGLAQQRVIRAALANAGLTVSDVDVVEAHGTGTRLGDPIEAQAVLATYGQDRAHPLLMGSVKSNIGHTMAAAGVAGIIKMVQAMRHGIVPKTLHVNEPTPHVDWSAGRVSLVTEAMPWPETSHPRRAAVTSFGISGTNAHVIIEQAPPEPVADPAPASVTVQLVPWLISGATAEAVQAQADRLVSMTERPIDVGRSLAGRTALGHRAAVVAEDRDGFVRGLTALAGGGVAPGVVRGVPADRPALALLFTGQGSQRLDMGRELYRAFPVFAEAFDAVATLLDRHLPKSVTTVLGEDLLHQTMYTQAGLFAVEVAVFRLLRHWGVTPDFVAGHSIGEIAAAHVAGVLTLEDACELVAARGRLMQALPEGGAMAALQATEDEVLPLLTDRVSVAAMNGPNSTVISGDEDVVGKIVDAFAADGRKTKRLRVSHAFHSPLMEPMLAEFAETVARLTFTAPQIPIVSTVTGQATDVCSPDYWVGQVRKTVRFADAVRTLADAGVTAFLEVGPDGVLTAMAKDSLPDATVIPSLRADRSEVLALTTAMTQLHVHGMDVDWSRFFEERGARPVDLPTYAFQRRRYWLDPPTAQPLSPSSPVDGWCHRVEWRPIPEPSAPLPGPWLVVSPEDHPALAAVRRAFEERGTSTIHAPHTDEPVAGVLVLLPPEDQWSAERPAVSEGLATTIDVVRRANAPVWCVTSNAVAIRPGDSVDPMSAQIWGLGRVLALEHPDRWGGLIDIAPDLADARGLVAVLGGEEDQVAVRPSGIFGRRLVQAARPAGTPWQPDGTVLVTGGLGALGAEVARWLARTGAEHVVLTARRGADTPGADDLVAELQQLGTRVTVAACDVADRASLAKVLDAHPPTAVFHAAGVLDDGVFDALTLDRFEHVLRPKVLGALNLHELAPDLKAFVLFSSVTGVIGNAGQANYAAANAFLDAFAEQRRAIGLPATAVAWGPWAQAGMAADGAVVEDRMRRGGLQALQPALAITALQRALDDDETCLTVVDIDWDQFTSTRPMPLISELVDPRESSATPDLRTTLTDLSEEDQQRGLLELVRQHVATVLGHTSAKDIPADKAFKDVGFDSLTVVELRNVLAAATGIGLPASVIFDYPTPAALAAHLRAELFGAAPAKEPVPVEQPVPVDQPAIADDLLAADTLDDLLDLVEEELEKGLR